MWCNVWNVWNVIQFNTGYINLIHGPVRRSIMASLVFTGPTERVYQKLVEREYECPITLEPINEGDEYYRCSRCRHPFSKNGFTQWLQTRNNCPLCRSIH